MICLAEDVVYAEKPHLGTSRDPGSKSVTGEGVHVTRERVQLIPVDECVNEK